MINSIIAVRSIIPIISIIDIIAITLRRGLHVYNIGDALVSLGRPRLPPTPKD